MEKEITLSPGPIPGFSMLKKGANVENLGIGPKGEGRKKHYSCFCAVHSLTPFPFHIPPLIFVQELNNKAESKFNKLKAQAKTKIANLNRELEKLKTEREGADTSFNASTLVREALSFHTLHVQLHVMNSLDVDPSEPLHMYTHMYHVHCCVYIYEPGLVVQYYSRRERAPANFHLY